MKRHSYWDLASTDDPDPWVPPPVVVEPDEDFRACSDDLQAYHDADCSGAFAYDADESRWKCATCGEAGPVRKEKSDAIREAIREATQRLRDFLDSEITPSLYEQLQSFVYKPHEATNGGLPRAPERITVPQATTDFSAFTKLMNDYVYGGTKREETFYDTYFGALAAIDLNRHQPATKPDCSPGHTMSVVVDELMPPNTVRIGPTTFVGVDMAAKGTADNSVIRTQGAMRPTLLNTLPPCPHDADLRALWMQNYGAEEGEAFEETARRNGFTYFSWTGTLRARATVFDFEGLAVAFYDELR